MNNLRLRTLNDGVGIDFVDLELPSGLLWAKGNICKDDNGNYYIGKETDRGAYASWANIEPHFSYNGSTFDDNYNWGSSSSGSYSSTPGYSLTSSIDSNDDQHDIARALLGRPFRLPATTDFKELYDNTDKEFVTINDINCWKFMKKLDHSIYIIFPLLGFGYNQYVNSNNTSGAYWTSSYYSSENAYRLYMTTSSIEPQSYQGRYRGMSIRAVCFPNQRINITFNSIDNSSIIGLLVTITDIYNENHICIINENNQVSIGNIPVGNATINISNYMIQNNGVINIKAKNNIFVINCRYAPPGVWIDTTDYSLISAENWSTLGINKTINGIAVISNNHAFVIHLTEEQIKVIYTPNTTACTGAIVNGEASARTRFAGVYDTQVMVASYGNNNTYAAGYCINVIFPNGKQGYLGSIGELVEIHNNKNDIDRCISICNGTTLKNAHYWSSTYRWKDGNTYTFWEYRVTDDQLTYNTTKGNHYVRPFCEFV